MLEPATLLASVLALVISQRPLRTGSLFYVGGLGVTLLIGVIAAFVLGSAAASHTSTPKTWVSVITLLAGLALLAYVVWLFVRPAASDRAEGVTERMEKIAAAPAPAIIAAGAALANPGIFMLLAAKNISQLDPTTAQFVLDWALFAFVALIPLGAALLMLLIAPRLHPAASHHRPWVGGTTRANDRRRRPPRTRHIPSARRHHRPDRLGRAE